LICATVKTLPTCAAVAVAVAAAAVVAVAKGGSRETPM